MAFSGNFMCTSFKQELAGRQNTTLQTQRVIRFKLALYDNNASFDSSNDSVHDFKRSK